MRRGTARGVEAIERGRKQVRASFVRGQSRGLFARVESSERVSERGLATTALTAPSTQVCSVASSRGEENEGCGRSSSSKLRLPADRPTERSTNGLELAGWRTDGRTDGEQRPGGGRSSSELWGLWRGEARRGRGVDAVQQNRRTLLGRCEARRTEATGYGAPSPVRSLARSDGEAPRAS